jgi:2-polyprenyl-6-methoxyphenol hydroxylase-like FAD-dependent oxidoreductase
VIGADGAYSGVRQSMYRTMMEQGILPKPDQEEFKIGYTAVVGVAKGLDPKKYPGLLDEDCKFNQIIYSDNSSVRLCVLYRTINQPVIMVLY